MKHISLLLILTVLVMPLGMVRFDETISAGETLAVHYNSVNRGTEDYKNIKLRGLILETGDFFSSYPFDLDDGDVFGRYVFWKIPYSYESGIYTLRLTLSSDDFRVIRYYDLFIV